MPNKENKLPCFDDCKLMHLCGVGARSGNSNCLENLIWKSTPDVAGVQYLDRPNVALNDASGQPVGYVFGGVIHHI